MIERAMRVLKEILAFLSDVCLTVVDTTINTETVLAANFQTVKLRCFDLLDGLHHLLQLTMGP